MQGHEGALQALLRHPRVAIARADENSGSEIVVELHPREAGGEEGHHFLIETLVGAGYRIQAIAPKEHKLEDVFLRLTQGRVQ